ncbi:MAG TPA: hypothetical protein ENJ92_01240 [Chloroflexi bacterium]|nr:hypothetical protein [Chloroflexota bacterium]
MSANQIAFVVDGEWLTNICRQLWADDGNPDKAINLLDAAFPNMNQADKVAILTGEKKLIGDSNKGIELVEDNAVTSNLGNPLSISKLLQRQQQLIEIYGQQELMSRQMAMGETVRVISSEGLVEIPLCCASYHAHGNYWYLKKEIDLRQIPHCLHKTSYTDKSHLGQRNDDPEEQDQESRVALRISRKIDNSDGWLSPEGKFYACGWMEHINLADRLGYSSRRLEKMGWIKLSANRFFAGESKASQAQINLIWDFCQEYDRPLPWWLEQEMENE